MQLLTVPSSPDPKSPKSPNTSRGTSFSSLRDILPSSKDRTGGAISSTTSAALGALKDVLEAVDQLPCVKYIASVGVKVLEIIDVRHFPSFSCACPNAARMQEVKTNSEDLRVVGVYAKDIVIAVATACEGARAELAERLEKDLEQLTGYVDLSHRCDLVFIPSTAPWTRSSRLCRPCRNAIPTRRCSTKRRIRRP